MEHKFTKREGKMWDSIETKRVEGKTIDNRFKERKEGEEKTEEWRLEGEVREQINLYFYVSQLYRTIPKYNA